MPRVDVGWVNPTTVPDALRKSPLPLGEAGRSGGEGCVSQGYFGLRRALARPLPVGEGVCLPPKVTAVPRKVDELFHPVADAGGLHSSDN